MKRKSYKKPPAYRRWISMRERCNNPNCKDWSRYGGRGIKVCERWNTFANFIADVGYPPFPGAQIDRIDNERGYEPNNVRWSTPYEQQVNSRTKMVWVEVNGIRLSWKMWARKLGVSHQALSYRALVLHLPYLSGEGGQGAPLSEVRRGSFEIYHRGDKSQRSCLCGIATN